MVSKRIAMFAVVPVLGILSCSQDQPAENKSAKVATQHAVTESGNTLPTSEVRPAAPKVQVKKVNYQEMGDAIKQLKGKVIVADFYALF